MHAQEEDSGDPREQQTSYNRDNSWRDEIHDFAEAVLEDKPVVVGSSDDALQTMHLVYRIYCADSAWKKQFNLDAQLPKESSS